MPHFGGAFCYLRVIYGEERRRTHTEKIVEKFRKQAKTARKCGINAYKIISKFKKC